MAQPISNPLVALCREVPPLGVEESFSLITRELAELAHEV